MHYKLRHAGIHYCALWTLLLLIDRLISAQHVQFAMLASHVPNPYIERLRFQDGCPCFAVCKHIAGF
jgi:hypothetical protein